MGRGRHSKGDIVKLETVIGGGEKFRNRSRERKTPITGLQPTEEILAIPS